MNNFFLQLNLLINFFSKKEKKILIYFLFFSLFISLSTVLSISLILPIFSIIENNEIVLNNKFIFFFYKFFEFNNINYFIYAFSIISIFLLIFTNFLNFLVTKNINKIICKRVSLISNQILQNYVKNKFEFFLFSKKSELLQDVIHEVQLLVFSCLLSFADIFTKSITIFFFLILLVIIQPYVSALLVLVFIFAYYLILKNAKNKSKQYGDDRLILDKERFSIVTDIFNSIQEIKIYNAAKYFVDKYKNTNSKFAEVSTNQLNLLIVPKYVLETIIYIIFLFFILLISSDRVEINNILPDLMIFGISAIKIIPQSQQIYTAFTKFKFYSESLNKISKIHNNIKKTDVISEINKISIPKNYNQINLENISFKYKNIDKKIFNNISINFNKGDIVGIIGGSGSGKTTLINLLSGLLQTDQGNIKLNGKNINDYKKEDYLKSISYIPQNVSILNQSIKDNILFGNYDMYEKKHFQEVIDIAELSDVVNQSPKKENYIVGESGLMLSGGQRQRIGIARALYRKPRVIILDEALNALNIEKGEEILNKIINNKNIDIKIIVTHNSDYIKKCTKVIELSEGKLNIN